MAITLICSKCGASHQGDHACRSVDAVATSGSKVTITIQVDKERPLDDIKEDQLTAMQRWRRKNREHLAEYQRKYRKRKSESI